MIIEQSDECPHFELEIEETITQNCDENGRHGGRYGGRVNLDRRSGLPHVVLQAFGYVDPKEYDPMTKTQKFLLSMQSCTHTVDLTPEEAEKIGEMLIQLAKDCRRYPDRYIR